MTDPQDQSPQPQWTFDRTLNIPTIVTVVSLFVGATMWSFNAYSELDKGIDEAKRTAESAQATATRAEAATAAQGQVNANNISSLRSEIRGDLRDMNAKLDALLFNQAGVRPGIKEWSK